MKPVIKESFVTLHNISKMINIVYNELRNISGRNEDIDIDNFDINWYT